MKRLSLVVAAALATAACAASPHRAPAARFAADTAAAAPEVLQESVFARDPQGALSEDRLQRVLDARLELVLPARVGVLPVVAGADWRGPAPDYAVVPPAVASLVTTLRGGDHFSLVTEMLPIPSGALGMEALREAAARYKLRYVLLYREDVDAWARANGWSALYATVLGALVLPGKTLHAAGYTEASLFDVKTGLLLFTVRQRVDGRRGSTEWHVADKLAELRRRLAVGAAPRLAEDVRAAAHRLVEALALEQAREVDDELAPAAGGGGGVTAPAAP